MDVVAVYVSGDRNFTAFKGIRMSLKRGKEAGLHLCSKLLVKRLSNTEDGCRWP